MFFIIFESLINYKFPRILHHILKGSHLYTTFNLKFYVLEYFIIYNKYYIIDLNG